MLFSLFIILKFVSNYFTKFVVIITLKVKDMIQTVKEFTQFAENINYYIENSNYKTRYFIESLDISKPTFYKKVREKSFSVKELNKIAELIYPQEFYEWKINQNKIKSREEVENGNFDTARNNLKELRNKYQNQ